MKPGIRTLLVLFCLLALPCSAFANAGTPLMWAGMLHLVFGNAVVGVFEGLLIAWQFALPKGYAGTWFNFGNVMPLGSATNSHWKFRTGFWPIEGLVAENKAAGQAVHFSYETPFGAWVVRNTVHLPSDKVLFNWGTIRFALLTPSRATWPSFGMVADQFR
jgi:hypothetical protein